MSLKSNGEQESQSCALLREVVITTESSKGRCWYGARPCIRRFREHMRSLRAEKRGGCERCTHGAAGQGFDLSSDDSSTNIWGEP